MFGKKKQAKEELSQPKAEKLPKPKAIPDLVARRLVLEFKKNPDWVWNLKYVQRPRSGDDKNAFDFRIFDQARTYAGKITIKDFTSLDAHPDLILYQGWFSGGTYHLQTEK